VTRGYPAEPRGVTVTFAGSGATSLSALKRLGLDPGAIADAAAEADLLIAEAYYRNKNIPYHLRLADIETHLDQLTARRIIVTHMSADMLAARHEAALERAHDGLTITL
jgi:hypothetical protein